MPWVQKCPFPNPRLGKALDGLDLIWVKTAGKQVAKFLGGNVIRCKSGRHRVQRQELSHVSKNPWTHAWSSNHDQSNLQDPGGEPVENDSLIRYMSVRRHLRSVIGLPPAKSRVI